MRKMVEYIENTHVHFLKKIVHAFFVYAVVFPLSFCLAFVCPDGFELFLKAPAKLKAIGLEKLADYALLSEGVYDNKEKIVGNTGNWEVIHEKSHWTGFHASLYRNDKTGECAITFEGTSPSSVWEFVKDGASDIMGGLMPSVQHVQSMDFAAEAYGRPDCKSYVTSGHSLGGGLAQTVGMGFDIPTYSFNPAALADLTSMALGSDAKVYSIVKEGEFLDRVNSVTDLVSTERKGNLIPVDFEHNESWAPDAFEGHSMTAMKDYLECLVRQEKLYNDSVGGGGKSKTVKGSGGGPLGGPELKKTGNGKARPPVAVSDGEVRKTEISKSTPAKSKTSENDKPAITDGKKSSVDKAAPITSETIRSNQIACSGTQGGSTGAILGGGDGGGQSGSCVEANTIPLAQQPQIHAVPQAQKPDVKPIPAVQIPTAQQPKIYPRPEFKSPF